MDKDALQSEQPFLFMGSEKFARTQQKISDVVTTSYNLNQHEKVTETYCTSIESRNGATS